MKLNSIEFKQRNTHDTQEILRKTVVMSETKLAVG